MENFNDLEMKYGPGVAYQILVEIEKASKIQSWAVSNIDPEVRLANALRAQDTIAYHFAAA